MKTEKPILMSTPMVQAILEGRKTQTRRIVKFDFGNYITNWIFKNEETFWSIYNSTTDKNHLLKCPYGQIGDILWVRETWQHTKCLNLNLEDENYGYIYKASENGQEFEDNFEDWKWKPSIFMPREACRIRLKITNIRVERLQDISEQDAINEGIEQQFDTFLDYGCKSKIGSYYLSPIDSYQSLWEKINGKDSWNLNPWVWVVSFKII